MGHSLPAEICALSAHAACGRRAGKYRIRPGNAHRVRKRGDVARADKPADASWASTMGPPFDRLRGGAISVPILAAWDAHRDSGAAELSFQGRQGLVETRWATETPTPPAR